MTAGLEVLIGEIGGGGREVLRVQKQTNVFAFGGEGRSTSGQVRGIVSRGYSSTTVTFCRFLLCVCLRRLCSGA